MPSSKPSLIIGWQYCGTENINYILQLYIDLEMNI